MVSPRVPIVRTKPTNRQLMLFIPNKTLTFRVFRTLKMVAVWIGMLGPRTIKKTCVRFWWIRFVCKHLSDFPTVWTITDALIIFKRKNCVKACVFYMLQTHRRCWHIETDASVQRWQRQKKKCCCCDCCATPTHHKSSSRKEVHCQSSPGPGSSSLLCLRDIFAVLWLYCKAVCMYASFRDAAAVETFPPQNFGSQIFVCI